MRLKIFALIVAVIGMGSLSNSAKAQVAVTVGTPGYGYPAYSNSYYPGYSNAYPGYYGTRANTIGYTAPYYYSGYYAGPAVGINWGPSYYRGWGGNWGYRGGRWRR